MRLALISGFPCENSTSRVLLAGLKAGYEIHGVKVAAAGVHCGKDDHTPDAFAPLLCIGGHAKDKRAYYRRLYPQVLRLIAGRDAVHYHHFQDGMTLSLAAVWSSCREAAVPFYVTLQDCSNPYEIVVPAPSVRRQSMMWFEKCLMDASGVSTLSRFSTRLLRRSLPKFNRPVHIIPNGYDSSEADQFFPSPPERTRAEGPTIVCVARLAPYKGIDVLLRAWKRVCREDAGVRLIVCGAGDQKKKLLNLATHLGLSGRVEFAGELPRPQLWGRIRQSLFTVLPSRHESFGMAVIESMACGKAVVATRSGGPQEIIANGSTGFLVPPKEPASLSRAMLKLLRNPTLARNMGRQAAKAADHYQWQEITRRYLKAGVLP